MIRALAVLPGRVWAACLAAGPLALWATILGAPAMSVFAWRLVEVIADPAWPNHLRELQLRILGNALYGALALVSLSFVSITRTRFRVTGLGGTSAEVGGDGPNGGTTP